MTNILHNMDILKYGSLAFFTGLDTQDLQALAPFFSSIKYVAGTVIFEQGDRADNLYLVATGEVFIRYKPDDGPMMTVIHVQSGGVFGWSAAMGNLRYTSGAVCSLDSEILFIRGDQLRNLCQRNPKIGEVLLERLSMVVADRRKSRQDQVTSILASGMRHGNENGGV